MIVRVQHYEGYGHTSYIRAGDYSLSDVVDVYFDHIRRARGIDLAGDSPSWIEDEGTDHQTYMEMLSDVHDRDNFAYIGIRVVFDIETGEGETAEEWVFSRVETAADIREIWVRRDLERVRHISWYEQSYGG